MVREVAYITQKQRCRKWAVVAKSRHFLARSTMTHRKKALRREHAANKRGGELAASVSGHGGAGVADKPG